MRVAYATPYRWGRGHAVRGAALAGAGQRAGLNVRAFGPMIDDPPSGYEGRDDWQVALHDWHPDLLLGDLYWSGLDAVRGDAVAWLLVRWVPQEWLADHGPHRLARWERRIAIEPAATLPGLTDRVPPIVWTWAPFRPEDGAELRAGYSTWWESIAFGYHERVRWVADTPERAARMAAPAEMTTNGADALMEMIGATI